MYSPAGMNSSCHTWVWPQKKPVQIHHDDYSDPIGRVIGARYVPYDSSSLDDKVKDTILKFADSVDSKSMIESAKILEDSNILEQPDWKGVGELVVDAIITDATAIEKILDGRYQGVSISQQPQTAICNLCETDWVQDGPCSHNRGEKDEETGRYMYLIVGDTKYKEISYINHPADDHAMGTSAESINNLSDSESIDDKNINPFDKFLQTTVTFQLFDSVEEELGMSQKDDTKSSVNENDTKPKDSVKNDPCDESSEVNLTIEQALKSLFEDEDNFSEEMADLINNELELIVDDSDAKLSTKQRKNLASSTFCGPKRSFPVPDCAHVTSARRLIGRYKGPGSKKSILACVSRKAKALGCAEASDQESLKTEPEKSLELSKLDDKDLTKLLLDSEKLMFDRGLKAARKCEYCEDKDSKITNFESQLPELQDTVKVLRSEYKNIVGEHSASEEAHSNTLIEYQKSLQDMAMIIISLTDREITKNNLDSKIKSMTFEELQKTVKDTDLSEVISFVKSGLSNIPTEEVVPDDIEKTEPTISDEVVELSKQLVDFRKNHGISFATSCLSSWIKTNQLPLDFTLDKASELVAK
jgi:hypothetical protein